MLLTNVFVSLLQKSKDPRIINVSSGMGSVTERFKFETAWAKVNNGESYRMTKAALNMLTACQAYEYKDWGCKVWAYCPGYVVTELIGADDRENRKAQGVESSETSAEGIKQIVEGERDGETHLFVQKYGMTFPW